MTTQNIMIVGVGGQGTLLASKLLGRILLEHGFDVKVSEVHGMSQRGGSVVTYVRFGDKVFSPVVDRGEADYIISFELLEAARWLEYLRPDGLMISNSQKINPMPVITGVAEYPDDLEGKISGTGARLICYDALSLAETAGTVKAVNLVLLGTLSAFFDFEESEWLDVIGKSVPPKFIEVNKKAFLLGRKITNGKVLSAGN
ncbi:MAG: indolepyruvate oxidoreductase subunit beta [Clostridia bacterium]|nr:indolepyruvate oxidoreductase subunit beta [Clostridia bacterium]